MRSRVCIGQRCQVLGRRTPRQTSPVCAARAGPGRRVRLFQLPNCKCWRVLGMFKMLFHRDDGRSLVCHCIGIGATELIHRCSRAVLREQWDETRSQPVRITGRWLWFCDNQGVASLPVVFGRG